MIRDVIQNQINEALKAHDTLTTMTLRMLSSALTNAEIGNRRVKLTEAQEVVVVKHEVKKRKDAIEALRQAQGKLTSSGRDQSERIRNEEKEMEILQKFLPEEMGEAELSQIVDEVISEAGSDFGKVMGGVMKRVSGRADGNRVSAIVRGKLSSS